MSENTQLQGVTSQKTWVLNDTALITLKLESVSLSVTQDIPSYMLRNVDKMFTFADIRIRLSFRHVTQHKQNISQLWYRIKLQLSASERLCSSVKHTFTCSLCVFWIQFRVHTSAQPGTRLVTHPAPLTSLLSPVSSTFALIRMVWWPLTLPSSSTCQSFRTLNQLLLTRQLYRIQSASFGTSCNNCGAQNCNEWYTPL